jgi:hypothetical protein
LWWRCRFHVLCYFSSKSSTVQPSTLEMR